MDGRPNCRSKAAYSNFSNLVCTGCKTQIQRFQLLRFGECFRKVPFTVTISHDS